MATVLTAADVQGREGLQDWRVVAGRLHATFRTGTLARGVELVRRIGAIADELDHHPDLDVRYFRVHVRSVTHDAGGLTERDVRLARRISAVAAELGLTAEPARTEQVVLSAEVGEVAAALPFWQTVLGYRLRTAPGTGSGAGTDPAAPAELVDPAGRGPAVHLHPAAGPAPPRHADAPARPHPGGAPSRPHLGGAEAVPGVRVDVHLPHDAVAERLAATLDAGGRLVSDAHAPSWWVLEDPDGTRVRLCTWQAPPSST